MSQNCLDSIADVGIKESFKLDRVSSTALHRVQAIYRVNCGLWVKKDYLVRRALRFYLSHLQKSHETKFDEIELLTKAVEGVE